MTRRGVYVLELNSGRFYVGSSEDIDSRVAQHGDSPVVGGHGGIFRVHPPMAPHNQNQRAGKKVLSEATEMYPRGITRPCKQKTDARIGIRVPLANSTRKNRGKNGGFCGGAPGRDAKDGKRSLTFTCPENATQRATRAKLRAKKKARCSVSPTLSNSSAR